MVAVVVLLLVCECVGLWCVCVWVGGWCCECFRALGAGDWSTSTASFGAAVVRLLCIARFAIRSAAVRVARFGVAVVRVARFDEAAVFDAEVAVFRVARFAGAAAVLRFGAAAVLRRIAPLRTDRGAPELHWPASDGSGSLRAALHVPAGIMAMLRSKSMSATLRVG